MKAAQLKRFLDEEVYDVTRAAEYLGVKRNSLEVAALRGRIPHVHWAGKKLFTKADLDYYKANRGQGRASRLQDLAKDE